LEITAHRLTSPINRALIVALKPSAWCSRSSSTRPGDQTGAFVSSASNVMAALDRREASGSGENEETP
jgi:hypothetical protein